MASTTSYGVTGMTCGHCVTAVNEEISVLEGVSRVDVDLVEGGESVVRVTSEDALALAQARAAVAEAGYELVGVRAATADGDSGTERS